MNKSQNCIVYRHTNKINGKSYIGIIISDRKPKDRWGVNGSNYLNNAQPKFANAIKKYGWENFEHVILFEHLTVDEAKLKEQEMIQKYNSFRNGYNATLGGDGVKGKKFSQKTKEKLRIARIGKKLSKETKEKISHAEIEFRKSLTQEERNKIFGLKGERNGMYGVHRFGEKNPFYGRKHSLETKNKISKANSNRISPKRKRIIQFSLDGKFIKNWNSMSEAATKLGMDSGHISQCCNFKRKNAYGFIWRLDDGTN